MAQVALQPSETFNRLSHYRADEPLPIDRLKAIVEMTVADVFSVEIARLRAESRGQARVAHARQVAMYLMHCAFGVSLTDIGLAFSRDRTTVGHACKIVEDRRDEANFDYMLCNLEEIIRHRARVSTHHTVS